MLIIKFNKNIYFLLCMTSASHLKKELVEAVILPMNQGDRFKTIGIKPPKGMFYISFLKKKLHTLWLVIYPTYVFLVCYFKY
jgi:hypothetical protein